MQTEFQIESLDCSFSSWAAGSEMAGRLTEGDRCRVVQSTVAFFTHPVIGLGGPRESWNPRQPKEGTVSGFGFWVLGVFCVSSWVHADPGA